MIPLQDDNPTELTPLVTITFIGICVLAFLYQASLPRPHAETLVFQYGAIPALLFGRADLPPTPVTTPSRSPRKARRGRHGATSMLMEILTTSGEIRD